MRVARVLPVKCPYNGCGDQLDAECRSPIDDEITLRCWACDSVIVVKFTVKVEADVRMVQGEQQALTERLELQERRPR